MPLAEFRNIPQIQSAAPSCVQPADLGWVTVGFQESTLSPDKGLCTSEFVGIGTSVLLAEGAKLWFDTSHNPLPRRAHPLAAC